jgi:hypothetical protein
VKFLLHNVLFLKIFHFSVISISINLRISTMDNDRCLYLEPVSLEHFGDSVFRLFIMSHVSIHKAHVNILYLVNTLLYLAHISILVNTHTSCIFFAQESLNEKLQGIGTNLVQSIWQCLYNKVIKRCHRFIINFYEWIKLSHPCFRERIIEILG